MTRDRAKELLPVIQAYADGRAVQIYYGGEWHDLLSDSVAFKDESPTEYRIKPEPTLRPWRAEEVPVGVLLRAKCCVADVGIIVGRSSASIRITSPLIGGTLGKKPSFDECLLKAEHSTDGGKTWNPCGVLEP